MILFLCLKFGLWWWIELLNCFKECYRQVTILTWPWIRKDWSLLGDCYLTPRIFDPFLLHRFISTTELRAPLNFQTNTWSLFCLQQQLGLLVPLEEIDGVSSTEVNIPQFEGFNSIRRSNLVVTSKHVRRKHISIHASKDGTFQLTVVNISNFLPIEIIVTLLNVISSC
jgi:hypothetical protein